MRHIHIKLIHVLGLLALLFSLLGSPVFVTPARAIGFTVTKTADTADGTCNADCSLREAISAANATTGVDTISLPPGTYTLTRAGATENANSTGDLDVTSQITINGTGKGIKIIQAGTSAGSGIDRVFHIVSGSLTLNDITIRNGRAPTGANGSQCGPIGPCQPAADGKVGSNGGGILNDGALTLNRVSMTDNWAGTGGKAGNLVCTLGGSQCNNNGGDGGNGGGIYNAGSMTVSNSTFTGNRAGKGGAAGSESCAVVCNSTPGIGRDGGAIYNVGAFAVTITGSSFTENSGDTGLSCTGGQLCFAHGGAIANKGSSMLTVTSSRFMSNTASAGGAIDNRGGKFTITGSTFLGNLANVSGGAIFTSANTVSIANSTFVENASDNGGIFNSDGSTLTVTNSTFDDSPFFSTGLATLNLFNNILTSANATVDCFNNGGGSKSNNLAKSATNTVCGLTNGSNGNIVGPDPLLGNLTGSPEFYPLTNASPALNAGSDAKCAAAPVNNTSQNGLTRPQGAHCDIGSFERDGTPPTVLSSVRANPNPTKAATVTFAVTFSEAVSGVDLSDFTLVNSGSLSGFSVTNVSGSGTTRTVTVNTGTGSGVIRLNVLDNNSIIDAAGNPLNGSFVAGENYTIDRTGPTVTSNECTNSNPSASSTASFSIVFDENVSGLDPADFNLVATGVTGASIQVVSFSGNLAIVTVGTGSGNGTLRIDLPANATITDSLGNPLTGLPYTSGGSCVIDKDITLTLNSVGVNDGFVLESGETTNVGGTINSTPEFINVGDDGVNRQFRSVLHFDTSSIPDNAVITSVVLKTKLLGIVGTDPFTTHGDLRVDIGTPSFGAAALELTDFQIAPTAANVAIFNPTPVDGVYSATLNGTGLSNIGLTGSTQLRLRFLTDDNNNAAPDLIRFFSGDTATVANRPQLVIVYHLP